MWTGRTWIGLVVAVSITASAARAQYGAHQTTFQQGSTDPAADPGRKSGNYYRTLDEKILRARVFSRFFEGAQVNLLDLDSASGRHRDISIAIGQIAAETGKPYFGMWKPPRLPGFFFAEDIDAQPADYRAQALKSDASLWERRPNRDTTEGATKTGTTADHLDITNQTAVSELLRNISRVFNQDGGTESIGPIRGHITLNEWKLTPVYKSIRAEDPYDHDVDSWDRVMRLNQATHEQLYYDTDLYISRYSPPKRVIPLFSENAANSFRDYAATKGGFTKLPADRNEFNHCNNDDSCLVPLPEWIEFVPLQNTAQFPKAEQHWAVWEDWVYATWARYEERVAEAVSRTQAGNPEFKGVLLFTAPQWYSLRASSTDPITYQYYDANDVLQEDTVVLADQAEYDRFSPVTAGGDIEYLLKSRWVVGFCHETTANSRRLPFPSGLLEDEGNPPDPVIVERNNQVAEVWTSTQERFLLSYMAKGALCRKICEENGKIFSGFAYSRYLRDSDTILAPEYFDRVWSHVIDILQPAIIYTIGNFFIDCNRLDELNLPLYYDQNGTWPSLDDYRAVLQFQCNMAGELHDAWLNNTAAYRASCGFKLLEIPWHQTVNISGTAQFHAEAIGGLTPGLSHAYQWEINVMGDCGSYQTLTPGTEGIDGINQPTLTISNAAANHAAWYRCRVSLVDDSNGNALDERLTAGAQLTVDDKSMEDDFTNTAAGGQSNRDPGDLLDGTVTEVGEAFWSANADAIFADGGFVTNSDDGRPIASVPFDPAARNIVTVAVEADLNMDDNLGDVWLSVGFMSGTGTVFVNGEVWMLVRRDGRYTVFADGSKHKLAKGLLTVTQTDLKHAFVLYDPSRNTVSAWLDREPVLTDFDLHTVGFTPQISRAGVTSFRAGGLGYPAGAIAIDNFAVRVDTTDLPPITGDFNCDQDVDQEDFGHLQACMNGDNIIQNPNCWDADLDGDQHVNQADFEIFKDCISGSGIYADPDCAQ
jgi:hypothetical protein